MEAENHPDPFREAMHHGLQRAMQIVSCAVTAAQVVVYQQKTQARAAAERDERARRALHAQTRAEKDAARAGWAPAHDPEWLRQAGLHETAQAWGWAMPYADRNVPWHEPAAATAMRRSEERLRELHPYAMARYDRLRADGLGPAEAMQEAAPLFARNPWARDAPSTPRPALAAGNGTGMVWAAESRAPNTGDPGDLGVDVMALRGQQIAAALQEGSRANGRNQLGDDELRTVLETITNLPLEVIDRITRRTADDARAQAGHTDRTIRPWERDFPMPIDQVVATATARHTEAAAPRTPASRAPSEQFARTGPGHEQ